MPEGKPRGCRPSLLGHPPLPFRHKRSVELYRSRYREGEDLWTGVPLKNMDADHWLLIQDRQEEWFGPKDELLLSIRLSELVNFMEDNGIGESLLELAQERLVHSERGKGKTARERADYGRM